MNPAHAAYLGNLSMRYEGPSTSGIPTNSMAGFLRRAGLIKEEDLKEAQDIARSLNSTVDQILRNSCYITDLEYKNTQKARQMVSTNMAMEELVLTALRIAFHKNISLEQGLKYLGW